MFILIYVLKNIVMKNDSFCPLFCYKGLLRNNKDNCYFYFSRYFTKANQHISPLLIHNIARKRKVFSI